MTWAGEEAPPPAPPGLTAWPRILWRGASLAVVVFGGLAILLLIRLLERPIYGVARPWTPWITQGVCRTAFVLLRMGYLVEGRQMNTAGCVVANHASWLDIFALNARKRV